MVLNSNFFKLEVNGNTLEYEIITDEVDLLIESKVVLSIAIDDFKAAIESMNESNVNEVAEVRRNMVDVCIAIINMFFGEDGYQRLRSDMKANKKGTLGVMEHIQLAQDILNYVRSKRTDELIEDLEGLNDYA